MLVSQSIANLLNGVSQRPPTQRLSSQAEEQINGLSSLARGVMKRPPLQHVGQFTSDVTGWDDAFIHPINRDADERYHIVVADGEVFAFDALTGDPVTVLSPDGMDYLTDASGAGYRAVTIGDTTMLVNRGTVVKKGTTKTAGQAHEALVYVRQADFSTRYVVTIDGHAVAIRTVDQTTADARISISTDAIASDLMAALTSQFSAAVFTFTLHGSSIYIVRVDGGDFSLSVSDGLGEQGLKAVKGEVQLFEDLPARAPHGFVAEVGGNPESPRDNYYVQYDDNGKPEQDGVWREIPKPGVLIDFDESTLPHRLTREGSITRDVEHEGLPSVIGTVTPLSSDSTNLTEESWDSYITSGAAIVASVSPSVNAHDDGVKFTATGAAVGFAVRFLMDTSVLQSSELAYVRVYKNDVQVAERMFRPGNQTNRQFLSEDIELVKALPESQQVFINQYVPSTETISQTLFIEEALETDDVLEVALEYGSGASPSTYRRAILSFRPDSLVLYSGMAKRITLTGTVYPAGAEVTALLDSTAFDYTVGSSDESAATVAAGLKALIDAHEDYAATNSSASIDVSRADGADFTVSLPATFSNATVFHNSGLSLVASEHVGRTLKNLTDGSSGTITANGATTITVDELDGGADNVFAKGDVCTVVGSGRYFVFEPCPWKDRGAGDDETCKFPSFVDAEISDVFFHENRLGFLSKENVILSSSGDLFNFFRYTATDLRADDVIDVRSAHAEVTIFHSAVLWNEMLTVWSENAQFVLSGEPALTPLTVRLDPLSKYPNATDPRPVVVGDRMYFTRAKSSRTQVFEYRLSEDGETATALDITKDIPTYISGAPLEMIGDGSEGFIALLTDADDQLNLYVHSLLFSEENKVQASWSRWEFAAGTIVGLDFVDGQLGVVQKHADGAYLSIIDLDLTPDAAEKIAYLDRRIDEDTTGLSSAHAVATTTWTLPYEVATDGSEGTLAVVNRSTGEVYAVTRPAVNQVAVTGEGDLTEASVYIGLLYTFTYTFSTIYWRGESDLPDARGRLQLRYGTLQYSDTTDFTATVAVDGAGSSEQSVALDDPETDALLLSLGSENKNVTITLTNATPGPCGFSGLDWEGYFTTRSRRV